jgi:hypothetical protein
MFCILCTRRLDADEDRGEVRQLHEAQELTVLGDVEADLGHELDRIPARVLPGDERREQRLGVLLVADEIVVHDEDVADAEGVDRLDLGQDLRNRLGPGPPPVHDDDVAELAVERAPDAARTLESRRSVCRASSAS